jgi:hypothetical protein
MNMDPAMMQQIQQMQSMGQQVMQNMQDAGVDPQQFMQEAMQNGTMDFTDPSSMMQTMVDRGFMTADQATQMNGVMNNLMQAVQNQFGDQAMPNANRGNSLLNNIRRQLAIVADDEWAVLAPKIQRVLNDLADVLQNNPSGVPTGIAPQVAAPIADGLPNAQETPLARAWRELQLVLQNDQTPESQIRAKLTAWRQLHDAAKANLQAAQASLVQLVTLRQEGVLISLGIL